MKKVTLSFLVISLTFFPILLLIFGPVPYAKATLTSTNVVFVPSASCPHGGTLSTTDPAFAVFSFDTMEWADVDAANLAYYDTVVLMISTSEVPLNARAHLINWVDGGGKMIIYDSETVPSVDYSWLPYPMTTRNPGALGYTGGNITFVEYNTLGCTDPGNVTYYINTTIVPTGGWSDGVGDCNTFVTFDVHWFGDIKAQNYYSYPPSLGYDGTGAGWVHTYAKSPSGNGLFIYNGFDIDPLDSDSVPDSEVWFDGNLAKIWLMELQQPWGIHYNLPEEKPALYYDVTIEAYCYTEEVYVSPSITMDGTPTGFNTPHTFTDLDGTHTFTVPSSDPNGCSFINWNTGETSTTITVSSDRTYTAYYGTPDFAIDAWPDIIEIYPGEMANYTVEVLSLASFSFPVMLTVSGAPTGTSASFSVNPVTLPPDGIEYSNLTISTTSTTQPGLYNIYINGTSGDIVRRIPLLYRTLVVLSLTHDVAVTKVTLSETMVVLGYSVFINVTVENQGAYKETFDVSVYYTRLVDPLIGTQHVTHLRPRESRTLTFEWTPNGAGIYQILSNTTEIPGDFDTANNTLTTIISVAHALSGINLVEAVVETRQWIY